MVPKYKVPLNNTSNPNCGGLEFKTFRNTGNNNKVNFRPESNIFQTKFKFELLRNSHRFVSEDIFRFEIVDIDEVDFGLLSGTERNRK